MKTNSYLFIFLFLLFASTFSLAQDKYKANIHSFTTDDGLSHLDVFCFEKDSKGVLWVGTRDGLNRFDGRKFKVFTKESGLKHKSVNLLYRDDDFLWCIHHNRTNNTDLVSIFHTKKEEISSLTSYLGEALPFKEKNIQKIYKVQDALIFKTQDGNTSLYTRDKGFKSLPFIGKKEVIKGVLENGDLWVLDPIKPYLYLTKITNQGQVLFTIEQKDIPFYDNLTFLYQNSKGESYFGYSPSNEIRLWLIIDKQGNFKSKEASFVFDKKNRKTVLSYYSKYYPKYNAYWYTVLDTCALLGFNGEVLYKEMLKVKDVRFLFLDKNSIWMAHQQNGFIQLELKKNKFKNFFVGEFNGFRGITKIKDFFYLNSHLRLLRFDDKFTTISEYPFTGLTILKDKQKGFWAFKHSSLVRFSTELEPIESFDVNYTYHLPVWSIYQDKNGKIWYSDIGLKSFNPKTEELKKVIYNEFSEIEKGIVYHFYEKENGTILLCTTTGLYEMQLGKGIIARYWSGGKGKYHIPADDFRHLYFDKSNQTYWLSTNETGLVHWNPKTNSSKVYTFNHRATNIIHAVYPDKFGFLWLSTEHGIIQFEKKTGDFKVYSTEEGTSTHEFNRISHFQDQESGKIYFGSILGLTVFDPKDFYQSFKNIDKVKIIPIEISQYKEDVKDVQNVTADFYEKKQVDFYPNDRFLNVILGLNEYRYAKDAVYYYKLKNIDEAWTNITNNEFSISGIPYGKQILEVKALLNNGKYTKKKLEIVIYVYKPFYLQWWFFVLIFLVIAGITLLYIRYRIKKFELQKIALEKEVKKRTLKIEEQTKKLVELDKTKTRFFANVSHELRTPITLIKAPIQAVITHQRLTKDNAYLLKKAKQNVDNLLNLVDEILDLTQLDNKKLKLQEEKVLFYKFIKQILSNFQAIAQVQEIEMTLEYLAAKELQILLDKDKFQKILNNLLANALKFTPPQGKITITIDDLGATILLKVKDTGRGIPKQDIPHVFERYFQASQNNKAEGGLGIGLALAMELIKLFKGKISLESSTQKENQGSSFFVKFPKKEVLNMLSSQDSINIEKNLSEQVDTELTHKNIFLNPKEAKKILIVEDNKDLREYLTFVLSNYYQVVSAENGKKAIDILSKERLPNLIISDLMMPIMDGYEFLDTVKNNINWLGIPFIILTARATRQDKLRALRVGVDDYITKPFDDDELLIRIENLVKNYDERLNYIQVELKNQKKSISKLTLNDKVWLESFENLIIEELNNSLFSIDFLAELMQIDRKTLYKKVKILTGLTPNQYVRAVRLKLAKDYLENKKYKSSKEVAISLGFKNTTYFNTLFKKEYGKLPNDYLHEGIVTK